MNLKRNMIASLCLIFTLGLSTAQASWIVKRYRDADGKIQILGVVKFAGRAESTVRKLQDLPARIAEHDQLDSPQYEEISYPDNALPQELEPYTRRALIRPSIPGSEVRTLVNQGPVANRINLTFVGDGYTAAEKEKFFADVARLTHDLFVGKAYASYLPLFNVHAVFIPSRESGLSDRVQKDTALGLYRSPSGSKRGIMLGDDLAADEAISLAPATDFPILIANDDYYGGLGGRYAISTRSVLSGTVVLRHELGHNFGGVGEEYDGGQVYTGANFAISAATAGWKQWAEPGGLREMNAKFLSGEYVWRDLSGGPYSVRFDFPSGGYRFSIDISSVGWKTSDDVRVTLDGTKVDLIGNFTDDRSFFTFELPQSLKPGAHTLTFTENVHDGDNVLAFAEVYALPPDYDSESGKIGAYSVFTSPGMQRGFRPTHANCPMREMQYEHFCPVDQENMWIRFLNRISLIDAVDTSGGKVSLKSPELPGLDIAWFAQDAAGKWTEIPALRGRKEWATQGFARGSYRVEAHFRTPEVRAYTPRFDAAANFSL